MNAKTRSLISERTRVIDAVNEWKWAEIKKVEAIYSQKIAAVWHAWSHNEDMAKAANLEDGVAQ